MICLLTLLGRSSKMASSTIAFRLLCACLSLLVCRFVSAVPLKAEINLIDTSRDRDDSEHLLDAQSSDLAIPSSEYVAYFHSSQDDPQREPNSDTSDNQIPPVTPAVAKYITVLLDRSSDKVSTEERTRWPSTMAYSPGLSRSPPTASALNADFPRELGKIEIVYGGESATRSGASDTETASVASAESTWGDESNVRAIVSVRTEIVTLRPSGLSKQHYVVDSIHGAGGMSSTSSSNNVVPGSYSNSTLTRIPNVFLHADSAVWGGCALVLICSIIIIVLIYSKICRTGPYQE